MSEGKARIGILGGSFDPIHFGHIKPSLALAEKYQLNSVRLLPCKISPFKDNVFVSSQHRWNMVCVIAASSELFVADARELERDIPSYTYDTLREIAEEFLPQAKLFWIMGIDALAAFHEWHQAEKILQLCHVLVMRRPGYELTDDGKARKWLAQYLCNDFALLDQKDFGHIYITDTEVFETSSTQIRAAVRSGEQPRYLVPGGVWNYIKKNNLYKSDECENEKLP